MRTKIKDEPGLETDPTPGQLFALEVARHKGGAKIEVRTLVTTSTSDTPAGGLFLAAEGPQTPEERRHPFYVQDLIPSRPTTANMVPYTRRKLPLTNETGAAMTAEAGTKPEVQFQYEADNAYVRKVTAWVPATDEILDDGTELEATVDTDLAVDLEYRVEYQVLNGDGAGANLKGIRQTTGLQTYAAPAGDYTTGIAGGLQKIEQVEGRATGVVMNTDDFWAMVTHRAGGGATGDNHYDHDPLEDAEDWRTWRVPVLRTRAIPAGKCLVGDFARGVIIRDREETTVRMAQQHLDWFTLGKVAIVAEKRLALPVKVPSWFCEVTFS